jgi:hypothetical protein
VNDPFGTSFQGGIKGAGKRGMCGIPQPRVEIDTKYYPALLIICAAFGMLINDRVLMTFRHDGISQP